MPSFRSPALMFEGAMYPIATLIAGEVDVIGDSSRDP
jgi:hypothetical protein